MGIGKGAQGIGDEILRYGQIISDHEYELGGVFIRQYVISYNGLTYHLTKQNGEWIQLNVE